MKEKLENLIADYLIVCWLVGIYVVTTKVFKTIFLGIFKLIEKIAIARERQHIMNQRIKENNGELE